MKTPEVTPIHTEVPTAHPAQEILAVEKHLPTSQEVAAYHAGRVIARAQIEKAPAGSGPDHSPVNHKRWN